MINVNDCVIVLIDIQDRLVSMLNKQEPIVKNTTILANAANILDIPIVLTEQYPQGLGGTIPDIVLNLEQSIPIIEKTSFSALQTIEFSDKLKSLNKKTIIIAGIETHICVYQTTMDLIDAGYNVVVAKDACASRSTDCFKSGIQQMKDAGAIISNVEIILFELLKTSKHPHFKAIQALIK